MKPTAAELQALLNSEDDTPVTINRDGSISPAQQAAINTDTRTCTCHPDDKPPVPCPRKFALTHCRMAALIAAATPFAAHDWMDAELEDDNCKLTKHSGPVTVGDWRALRVALATMENWR